MPVFNVEDFLDDAVISILNQTHKEWELLLVDDGSTDASNKICDKYAQSDDRISVRHILNSGVSHARNIGIQNSRGEYIVFCDSDDMLSPEFLSIMKRKMEDTDADIVRCFMKPIDETTHSHTDGNTKLKWTTYEGIGMLSIPQPMYDVVWGKFYRKSLIDDNGIMFDEFMDRGEDTLFSYKTVLCSSRIVYSDNEYVNYRIRNGSLMRSNASRNLYDQSVHKYYAICNFQHGKRSKPKLSCLLQQDALNAVVQELVKSAETNSVFRYNFQKFCIDISLHRALKTARNCFCLRTRFAIAIMLMLKIPIAAPLIRLMLIAIQNKKNR